MVLQDVRITRAMCEFLSKSLILYLICLSPMAHYFFFFKNHSYATVLWQSKLAKKSSMRFSSEIRAHLDHLFAWTPKVIKFNRWSYSKNGPNTVKSYKMKEKHHKRWNQECKQKQSPLFNFCITFDLLTRGTEKMAIAWWLPAFKSEFLHIFL